MRLPITLIIDDGTCVNPAYWLHPEKEHAFLVSNEFTNAFADLCKKYRVKGKFSVMPIPSGLGRIDAKLSYVSRRHLKVFLNIVRKKIAPAFDITPELLTHQAAYDLKTGSLLHLYEDEWVRKATIKQMTDYLTLAFRILGNVGLTPTGITSPWSTGRYNEIGYAEAIGRAYYRVFQRKFTWYFLHCLGTSRPRWPWVAWRDRRQGLTVVSVPALTSDPFWETQTQKSRGSARRFALNAVDRWITNDGRQGRLKELLNGGYPLILLTHWQSLYSEGGWAGLAGLAEAFARIKRFFGDKIEWQTLSEVALTAEIPRKS